MRRRLVQAKKTEYTLTNFEVTQLSNLCPSTAEEAKSLIKSLQTKIEVIHNADARALSVPSVPG